MLLYLVRHAIAEERDPSGQRADESRQLTSRGIARMRRNVSALQSQGVALEAIWTSPLARARQTGELLAELSGFSGRLRIVNELAPGGDLDRLMACIAQADCAGGLALVGHEPDLSELGSMLLSGRDDYAMSFKKGGVACIETQDGRDPQRGTLRWLLTPKQMRAMT